MESEQGKFPPPPGLIAALVRGFDSVAGRVLVILPPLLLDLFLWLGPRLRLQQAIQPLVDGIAAGQQNLPPEFWGGPLIQQNGAAALEYYTNLAQNFNLFGLLQTFPVGISSLLARRPEAQSALGLQALADAGSLPGLLGWAALLIPLGWLLGGVYFYWVAGVALSPEGRSFRRSVGQALLLSIVWVGLLFGLGLPALFLAAVVYLFSPFLGQLLVFAGLMFGLWMLLPAFFSPHGIYAFQLDAGRAILSSLRMVRYTLPNTALFVLATLLLNQGLGVLWDSPSRDSWWMLVGIAGHAFVSTALLAASFVYYRDINTWLKVIFEQLQKQRTQPQRT